MISLAVINQPRTQIGVLNFWSRYYLACSGFVLLIVLFAFACNVVRIEYLVVFVCCVQSSIIFYHAQMAVIVAICPKKLEL